MSRSYRKPYAAVTGVRSAADDKRVARRNWRHAQNNALRSAIANEVDWDEFLIPARLEAAYNDVWSWGRDGKQLVPFAPRYEECAQRYYRLWIRDLDEQDILKDFEEEKERFARLCRK